MNIYRQYKEKVKSGTLSTPQIILVYVHLVSIGRNQPLKPEKPKWKSEVPLTDGQLRSKRDEFWDTAPAFEGRKEIWDALKAAAYALETGDHSLAQAIIDGANISLPHGIFIFILSSLLLIFPFICKSVILWFCYKIIL